MSDEDKKNLEEVISEDVKDQSSENEKNPQEVTEDQPKVESDVNLDQSKEIDNKEKIFISGDKQIFVNAFNNLNNNLNNRYYQVCWPCIPWRNIKSKSCSYKNIVN